MPIEAVMKSLPNRQFTRQRGATAVEFAIAAMILLTVMFGVMEVSRMVFLWNTMTEVTNAAARDAAMTRFSDTDGKDALRRHAIFVDDAGQKMPLGGEITSDYLRIDYLHEDGSPVAPGDLPTCQIQNTVNCLNDPNGTSCVRFVRVRLCEPGSDCTHVPYKTMISLPALDGLNIDMPWFTAVVPLEAQGMPGDCT
jgi:hypothetical protein